MSHKTVIVAVRTAALYAALSAIWILLSDRILAKLVPNPVEAVHWSIIKGWAFVATTALLLYLWLVRQLRQLEKEAADRVEAEAKALKSANRQLFLTFLLEKSGQPLAVGYPDGRIGLVNRAFCELTGYSFSELKACSWSNDLTPPEWRERESQALAELRLNGHPVGYENELLRKDGSRVPIQLLVHEGTDETGEKCYYAIITNIAERKQAEKRLTLFAELGQRLNSTRTAKEAAEVVADVADKLFGWDACKLTLYPPPGQQAEQVLTVDTVNGRRVEFPPDPERAQPTPFVREVMEHGAKLVLQDPTKAIPGAQPFGDEARRSASLMFAPVRHGSKLLGIVTIQSYQPNAYNQSNLVVFQSLADYCAGAIERIRTEESVARKEALYRTLFDLCPDGIMLEDSQGRILDASHALCLQTGYTRDELLAMTVYDLTPPELVADAKANLTLLASGQTLEHRIRNRKKDGTDYLVELHEKSIVLPDGKPGILVVTKDVTQRQRIEAELRKLSLAVEQSPASIVITDRNGCIEYVNPKFCEVTGYQFQEVRGQNPRVLKSGELPPDKYRQLWQTIKAGQEWRGEFHNRRKNGELFWESASISPIVNEAGHITHFIAVKEDITRHKQLEEQFRHSQKMEAVGRLAGGVAHDFNNILTVIQIQAGLMEADKEATPALREASREIILASQRAANLTRQLLVFSRKQVLKPRDLDLNTVIANISKMLRRIVGEDIRVQLNFSGGPLLVHADEGMLDQILMNLTVNARDAMPAGGALTIETLTVELNAAQAADIPGARPGTFACLKVTDTGCGIEPEILPKIFEPFFTTKSIGKGTGLGLATVFGIVEQHQGWITPASQPGKGTTFAIYLPALTKAPTRSVLEESAMSRLRGGTETILLVEDERPVANMVRTALSSLGYRILEAANGADALALWEQHKSQIALVLTDLVMPGNLTGRELAQRLQADRPDLKLIYMSGYSPDTAANDLVLEDGFNFLPKPFPAHKLVQVIRARLDGDKPGLN